MIEWFVRVLAFPLLALLTACGGGSGGGGNTSSTAQPPVTAPIITPTLTNFTTVTVDQGPAALGTGANPYRSVNAGFVTITICAPGTSICQTIDHVQVDTGSTGLRIASAVLTPTFLATLPKEIDSQSNSVGECYGFVDGYAFGSVRQADFTIGGEVVPSMALQVVGDIGAFSSVPAQCSAGGGKEITSVKDLGANGIIGIGVTATDCGQACTGAGGAGAAIYFDCPPAGCGAIIGRASTTTAPFQQLPNPVAAMSIDNNGTVLTLPSIIASGATSLTGTLYFGIGTQANNGLPGGSGLQTTGSSDALGPGAFSVTYNGRTLVHSFIDSGSTAYFFEDDSLAQCTQSEETGFYCPASAVTITPTLTGLNGVSFSESLSINNADRLLTSGAAALPGLGANPGLIMTFRDVTQSFDFGLPFFYGKSIYTVIEGRTVGGVAGPYLAIH